MTCYMNLYVSRSVKWVSFHCMKPLWVNFHEMVSNNSLHVSITMVSYNSETVSMKWFHTTGCQLDGDPHPSVLQPIAESLPKGLHPLFPSSVSVRGYKIGPVCLCVCPSVSALMVEPFELRTRKMTVRRTFC